MMEPELLSLLTSLRSEPQETEWIEFKHNNEDPSMIGERLSALANVAALLSKELSYFVWGIEDKTHNVVGTAFKPKQAKVGNEELESWLSHHLTPRLDFRIHEFMAEGKPIVVIENPPAQHTPVRWKDAAYIRVGSYTKKLNEHPEKERSLWRLLSQQPFEKRIAIGNVSDDEVLSLLDYDSYYRLTKQALPITKNGILQRLATENMVVPKAGKFDITNSGAILFARHLSAFETLGRKAVRVIDYTGNNRASGGREYSADMGYASVFEALVSYVRSRLPNNEHIAKALRVETEVYPEIAIRELVANAVVHQDFSITGGSPLVEIFPNRIEIANAGRPLIDTLRFVDEPPQSRNEILARFMRRVNICEERGSGIDKVIQAVELFQLPAPEFESTEKHTRVTLFSRRSFQELSSRDRVWACYWHACLMQVSGTQMTNESLRKRLSLSDDKYNQASKVISDARQADYIKPYDPDNKSPRYARYVPFWA